MKSYGFDLRGLLLLGMTLLMCAGCWEEVHYIPSEPTVTPGVVDESISETEVVSNEAPLENNIAEEETLEPTTDELFGGEVTLPVQEEASEEIVESQSERAVEETTADIFASEEESAPEESPAAEVDVMRPSRTALAAWRMSSWWSLAAAIYAKGAPEERYDQALYQASYYEKDLNMQLPEFPTSDARDLEATMIGFLLESGTKQLSVQLSEEFSPQYTALAELAAKSHVLLLVYTPKSQQLDLLITEIRQAAENSGLPAELWNELVGMLERREPFAAVKQQVLAMHAAVGDYLAG